jgi:uncharacterized coiled-coil protein SlyX
VITVLADTTQHVARMTNDAPTAVYVSLAGLALTIAGITWKGGELMGELRAVRREHHKRLEDLEVTVKTTAHDRITREELNARFSEIRTSVSAMSDRVSDAVELMKEALKR